MNKDLWNDIKAVNAGKLVVSREQELEMVSKGYEMLIDDSFETGKLIGQADVFTMGGKALVGAGAIWLLIGKISRTTAKHMAEIYKPD